MLREARRGLDRCRANFALLGLVRIPAHEAEQRRLRLHLIVLTIGIISCTRVAVVAAAVEVHHV